MSIKSETYLLSFDFDGAAPRDVAEAAKISDVVFLRVKGEINRARKINKVNSVTLKCDDIGHCIASLNAIILAVPSLVVSEVDVSCNYWYRNQCNLWLSEDLVFSLGKIGASLSISCAEDCEK